MRGTQYARFTFNKDVSGRVYSWRHHGDVAAWVVLGESMYPFCTATRLPTASTTENYEHICVAPLSRCRWVLIPACMRPLPVVMRLTITQLTLAVERTPPVWRVHLLDRIVQRLH